MLSGYVLSVLLEARSMSDCSDLLLVEINNMISVNRYLKIMAISTSSNSNNYSMMIVSISTFQDISTNL